VVDLIWNTGQYSSGYGGEFNATLYYSATPPVEVQTQSSPVQIASQAGPLPSPYNSTVPYDTETPAVFQTFCIQEGAHDVTFSPGTYYAGVVGPSTVDENNPTQTQTVSSITATLFTLFWYGDLTSADTGGAVNYDYSNDGGRPVSAGELQLAIWVAQGDTTFTSAQGLSDAGLTTTAEVDEAEDYYDYAEANPIPYADAEDVEILGMYDTAAEAAVGGPTGLHQSQLVLLNPSYGGISSALPTPTSAFGGAVLMAGLGLMSLRSRRAGRI
jgi:hypothetical protein